MTKYVVHLYPVIRVTIEGIEAASPEEAARLAEARVGLDGGFGSYTRQGAEYADEMTAYLVDAVDGVEVVGSVWLDANGEVDKAMLPPPLRPYTVTLLDNAGHELELRVMAKGEEDARQWAADNWPSNPVVGVVAYG
jgi:hypothetical protein